MVGVQRAFCELKDIAEVIRTFEIQGLKKGSWKLHGEGQIEIRAWKPRKSSTL